MSGKSTAAVMAAKLSLNADRSGLLQRKCDCGNAAGLTGKCSSCQSKRLTKQPESVAQTGSAPVLHELIQPKLTVGEPGDKYDQEADLIADRVMRIPEPKMQRLCSECGEDLQRQLMEEEHKKKEEETLQTKTAAGELPTISSSLQNRITALQGGGQPLSQSERNFFEPRFGTNFSQVRIHTDNQAAQTASAVNARAFAVGRDVVFGAGQYQPSASEGRRLLAHELTHVIQQTETVGKSILTPRIQPKEDWDFTPADYATLRKSKGALKIAADSTWFPQKLQTNLLNTLEYTLSSKRSPSATEGINVEDFYHGHVVVPKTKQLSEAAQEKRGKFEQEQERLTSKALGGKSDVTKQNIGDFTKAIEQTLPLFGTALEEVLKIKGAAVIYHTFEKKQPSDLKAKGQDLKPGDPRRNYITPLATNKPAPYSPPDIKSASSAYDDYWHFLQFAFLVDEKGEVHIRPGSTQELSSVTGVPPA